MTQSPAVPVTTEFGQVPSAVEEIADLARRDTERVPAPYGIDADSRLVVAKLRADERIDTLNLEQYLAMPARARGHAIVHEPSDFAEYVKRVANPSNTTLWADIAAGSITAVINDHSTWDDPGWRDHTVRLILQADEDWTTWHQRNGKLSSQEDFAEFVESVAHTIIAPDAATMLEVATTFSAKRSLDFSRAVRLATGDVQLTCVESTQASAGANSNIEVPEKVTVRIAPWLGADPVDLEARLRWRIRQGQLTIGYLLLRSDVELRNGFAQLVGWFRESLAGLPVILGTAPGPVQ